LHEKTEALNVIDSMAATIIEISDTLHDHPELGSQEYKSVDLLTSELNRHGFEVETGLAGMNTAFKATFRGRENGPTIALLPEYDALPELGHACGHNIIAAGCTGAAIALSRIVPKLNGTVLLIGAPDEEGTGEYTDGKVRLIKAGLFDEVDAALSIHPSWHNSVGERSLAMYDFAIVFKGKAAHAAVAPHEGINALDAVVLTFNGISALRQHLKTSARIHGVVTEGGIAPNIIPDHASARFYVRSEERVYLKEIVRRVKDCARGAALATGAKVDFAEKGIYIDEGFLENMIPNPILDEALKQNMIALGLEMKAPGPPAGSTDVGNVSHRVPSAVAHIAIGPEELAPHTREFATAAGSDAGHKGLIAGAKVLAMTTIDLLTDLELMQKAKKEFSETRH
jgi:amidohydrolase